MRNRVGFRTAAIIAQEEIEVAEMTHNINNEVPATEGELVLSQAHIDTKGKIIFLENLIMGEEFSKLPSEEKKEYLDELKHFMAVDAQLYFCY